MFFFLLYIYLPGLTLVSAISDTRHRLALLSLPWFSPVDVLCPVHLPQQAPHHKSSCPTTPARQSWPGLALPHKVAGAPGGASPVHHFACSSPSQASQPATPGPGPPTISSAAVMPRQHSRRGWGTTPPTSAPAAVAAQPQQEGTHSPHMGQP